MLKKQRTESRELLLERESTVIDDDELEMPSPSNADEAVVTPATSRLGDFD